MAIKKNENNLTLAQRVGNKIATKRRRLGYTQVEVASMLGIEQESLSRMEKGVIAPKFSRLESLASVLECSVLDLFRSENESTETRSNYLSDQLEKLSKKDQKLALAIIENVLLAFSKNE